MTQLLELGVLGGLLALDATAVGQFMVSRPLVAGVLTGWIVGDPLLGMEIGAILELYLLVSFPTGGARFPEGSTATVVAVGSSVATGGAGAVPLAIALGLLWGQVGGFSITVQRRINGRIVTEEPGTTATARHLGAIGLDFLRGTALSVTGIVLGRTLLPPLARGWPLDGAASAGLLLAGGAVSAGILLRSLGGFRQRRILLVLGIALGIVGARFL